MGPLGFFIIQLGAENQNNQKGTLWRHQVISGKSLTMPKKTVKPNLLSCLGIQKAFKTMVAKSVTLWKHRRLLSITM